jgi:hypothetical protein
VSRTWPRALVAVLAATVVAPAAAAVAVEYEDAVAGHYFVTSLAGEIAALDTGAVPGWRRTGESFPVLAPGAPGTAPVCRFWTAATFAPRSSHFYTPSLGECDHLRGDPAWTYEGIAFAMALPDGNGACTAGTVPLYRFYNDGRSGAPNHRYTTHAAIRAEMLARGWSPEGAGPGVVGCVPQDGPTATIVAAGDIAQCLGGPAEASGAARTARLVTARDELVLTLGDNAYEEGSAEEFTQCFHPTWGAFGDRLRPTPGNHDYMVAAAHDYFQYFGDRAGPDRRGWMSFDHAGWHFVALNSNVDFSAGSEQHRWLQEDLARSASLCTVAYWHHPRFNSGGAYGPDARFAPLFDTLHAAGVEVLLSGHEHIYERFAPQAADGTADPARGVRQFVVGTGGHQLNPLGAPQPHSEFRTNAHWGVLRLTLRAGGYDWAFVSVDGSTVDAGSDACHR